VRKRDPIFWWASGIFVLALLLFAITKEQLWLSLMIGSYLLRPTLASLGVARRLVDERQMSIYYRSGNIGFVVMIVACVIMAIKLSSEGNHDFEMFIMAIIIGLAAKALFNVLLAKNYRESASKIIISAGLLIGLFMVMDGGTVIGTIMQAIPGIAIVIVGLLSRKFPRTIGVVVFGIAAVMLWLILGKRFTFSQVGVAIVVATPLILAGICLYIGDKSYDDGGPDAAGEKL
jgi:hypothetical protein